MKPKLERDKKTGRITKGVAQDTNKNGTAGRPCEYCKDKERIQKIADDYLKRCHEAKPSVMPYLEELIDILDIIPDTLTDWMNKKNEDGTSEHPEFLRSCVKIKNLQRLKLFHRTLGRFSPYGAIFQLKANHGLMETDKRVIAGDKEEPLEIMIVEERKFDGQD